MVDPTNRELLLSFGALLETLRQAAPPLGYRMNEEILAGRGDASDVARVDLTTAPAISSNAPSLIQSRATTRTPFLPAALDASDIHEIVGVDDAALHFVARDSAEGRWIVDAVGDAFAKQTWTDEKQGELAGWLRFSRREVSTRGDGLTPEALGLSPLSRTVWYAAFNARQPLRASFRRSSIKVARGQLAACAGFLLVTSSDRSVGALLETGAIYQRALLKATHLGVAHHTMSYALEEDPWREQIDRAMGIGRPIQFVVRVGRARHLAQPAVRRAVADLLR